MRSYEKSKIKGVNQHSYISQRGFFITERQLFIFKMLASGYNTKQIASMQNCSQRSVYHAMGRAIKRNGYSTSWQALYSLSKKKIF